MPAVRLKSKICAADIIRKGIISWLVAANIEYLLIPSESRTLSSFESLLQMSLVRFAIIAVAVFAVLCIASYYINLRKIERWIMLAAFATLSALTMLSSYFFFFLAICGLMLLMFAAYAVWGWDSGEDIITVPEKKKSVWVWITAVAALVFIVVISAWSIRRTLCFQSQTYDFGLFSQMFYYMKETGRQLTTLERDGLLSHFAVHVSPIYYLILPFYLIFPRWETLDVMQAVILASAVIPLWKICRFHGLKDIYAMFVCLIMLVYPSFSGGTSLGLHENCFLTPLLLWLFYGIDKGNITIISISAFLTLMVKEDAAIYVAVIALWLITKSALREGSRKKTEIITGIIMLVCALLWFVLTTNYLSTKGTGVLSHRYENFLYEDDSSLFGIVKACLLQPMRLIYECVGEGKRVYIIFTLAPLLGLPLLTRKYERLILLIPYILINLMPDYAHQHDVFQQYGFGPMACLFYLAVVNFSELDIRRLKLPALMLALAIGIVCFIPNSGRHIRIFVGSYGSNEEWYEAARVALDKIPEDASVSVASSFTALLSERDIVYDTYYTSEENLLSTDYVAVSTWCAWQENRFRTETQTGYEYLCEYLEEKGYELFQSGEGGVIIYKKP